MRIFYVNSNYPVSMALYADRLWQNLAKLEPGWSCDSLAKLDGRIEAEPNKYLRNLREKMFYPAYLNWFAKRKLPDLVHIIDHSHSFLIDHFDASSTIVTCHDLILHKLLAGDLQTRNKLFDLPVATVTRNVARVSKIVKARKIVAVSQSTKTDLMRYLTVPAEQIEVIYSGLNWNFRSLPPGEREKLKIGWGLQGKRIMLCVGNNLPYKNIEAVIMAYAEKKDCFKARQTVIVKAGADFNEEQKKLIDRFSLRREIIYLGRACEYETLNAIYNLADLFIFPSLHEGFGWPPLEAMACGVPVIASAAGSLPEVLNDSALTVEPLNHRQLAEMAISLLDDEQAKERLIKKGLNNVTRFSWLAAAEAYRRLYEQVRGCNV
jgi:glycosyltransferase involved in cell wall biosynthesis